MRTQELVGHTIAPGMVDLEASGVSQPLICRHAGGAPGDRSERPVPGHLQHEEEGDGELTEGNCFTLGRLCVMTAPPPKG